MGRKERGTINPYLFYTLRKQYSVEEIAKIVGYTQSGLSRWCARNYVDTTKLTDFELAEEIRLKTPKEIAYEYNMCLHTVYKKLRVLGISTKLQRGKK